MVVREGIVGEIITRIQPHGREGGCGEEGEEEEEEEEGGRGSNKRQSPGEMGGDCEFAKSCQDFKIFSPSVGGRREGSREGEDQIAEGGMVGEGEEEGEEEGWERLLRRVWRVGRLERGERREEGEEGEEGGELEVKLRKEVTLFRTVSLDSFVSLATA